MKQFGLIMIFITNVLLILLGWFIIQLTTFVDANPFTNPITYVVAFNLIIVWIPAIFIVFSGIKKWYLFYGVYAIAFLLAGIFIPITLIITLFYILGAIALKSSMDEQPA